MHLIILSLIFTALDKHAWVGFLVFFPDLNALLQERCFILLTRFILIGQRGHLDHAHDSSLRGLLDKLHEGSV